MKLGFADCSPAGTGDIANGKVERPHEEEEAGCARFLRHPKPAVSRFARRRLHAFASQYSSGSKIVDDALSASVMIQIAVPSRRQ